ncbi:glycosyltransferase family 4 protein [Mangrovimonas cancribranchiae]|uniref:Glycosyltransferase family 4 protein n=1 Tax=Mangrovimonas cancribranchiae TaxID=3080055 RepID=A0AAU6P1A2_9FLAO
MKKSLLYIGNNLNSKRSNISSIGVLGPMLEAEGITVYYASSKTNKLYRLLDMIWQVLRNRHRVSIVLIDTYSTWNFYYALVISQLCRLLRLCYIPSLNGGNLPMRLQQNPVFCRMIFKPAYKLVSPSIYLKEAFETAGFTPVTYIPNSITLGNYTCYNHDYEQFNLLWVRSFSYIYNPTMAVEVLKTLLDNGYQATLTMVGPDTGDGSLQATKTLAKTLGVAVTFTGKLSKPDWIALAKTHNIFINTTNYDNMPVSVIEAMALGLAVVSTRVGGIPYFLEHLKEAVLVPAENAAVMAKAIVDLKASPENTRHMVQNARSKAENFDWNHVKQDWLQLLQ